MNFNTYSSCIFFSIAALVCCEYNEERWMYFTDDNGTTHVLNYSLPTDSRGFLFGDAYFYLYTSQNIEDAEELVLPSNENKITSKYFNESNDIRAITHGWLSSSRTDWMQQMKENFLKLSDFNIILVDWNELSKNYLYPWPALCTRYVGKQLNKLLISLSDSYEIKDRNIHLIGHSLGAHVMGYTGMFSKGRVDRITGLDPARPLFELPDVGPDFRLDATDADFVDIIHTDGGTLGYCHSHGSADFYPDGGSSPQPGCEDENIKTSHSCNHGKAPEYFIKSIIPSNEYYAYACMDWNTYRSGRCTSDRALLGYPSSYQSFGDYYLSMNTTQQ